MSISFCGIQAPNVEVFALNNPSRIYRFPAINYQNLDFKENLVLEPSDIDQGWSFHDFEFLSVELLLV